MTWCKGDVAAVAAEDAAGDWSAPTLRIKARICRGDAMDMRSRGAYQRVRLSPKSAKG